MKIFKFCLLPALLLVTVVFVFGLFCPKYWDVEVSARIAAKPEVIHPWIDDLSRWEDWVLWAEGDAEFEFSYEGEPRGVGAIATSEGPGSRVRWEITFSDSQKGVWFDELLEGRTHSKGAIMFEVQGESTQVTWVDRGSLGTTPLFRLANLAMQSALSKAYRRNLDNLKARIDGAGRH